MIWTKNRKLERHENLIQKLLNRMETIEHEVLKLVTQSSLMMLNQSLQYQKEEETALVCPDCNKKEIVLISEEKKQWWCNPCKNIFTDLA